MDNPSELQLIAQFDYAPEADGKGIFTDFRGTVNPIRSARRSWACSPTAHSASVPLPGHRRRSVNIDLVGTITQVDPGNRVLLANDEAQILPGTLDTAFKDIARGRLAQGVTTTLTNSGVPFIFIDQNVRNSLRYFYSVVAFDVNSLASGPSSIESSRNTKPVIPVPLASNAVADATIALVMSGRNGPLTNTTVRPSTRRPASSATGAAGQRRRLNLVTLVSQLVGAPTQLAMRLDSMTLGQTGNTGIFGGSLAPQPHVYW